MAGMFNGCSENDRHNVIDFLGFCYRTGTFATYSSSDAPRRYLLPLPLQPRDSVVGGAVV